MESNSTMKIENEFLPQSVEMVLLGFSRLRILFTIYASTAYFTQKQSNKERFSENFIHPIKVLIMSHW